MRKPSGAGQKDTPVETDDIPVIKQVSDALGRVAATAAATGTAALGELALGLDLVRVGSAAVRLAVE